MITFYTFLKGKGGVKLEDSNSWVVFFVGFTPGKVTTIAINSFCRNLTLAQAKVNILQFMVPNLIPFSSLVWWKSNQIKRIGAKENQDPLLWYQINAGQL